jgi:hypothetical protein
MKNGLVLALAILGGLYFLSRFGFRSWPLCPGWGQRSSYFNNYGIGPGHPLFWVSALIILVIAVVGFFFKSAGRPASPQKKAEAAWGNKGRIPKNLPTDK